MLEMQSEDGTDPFPTEPSDDTSDDVADRPYVPIKKRRKFPVSSISCKLWKCYSWYDGTRAQNMRGRREIRPCRLLNHFCEKKMARVIFFLSNSKNRPRQISP